MKKQFKIGIALMIAASTLGACKEEKEAKKETKVETNLVSDTRLSDGAYTVEAGNSVLYWKANQIGGGHHGTFGIESGSIQLENNNITGGSFVIDVKSLKVIDVKDAEDNKDITAHLLNPDFFDSDKFPKAYFEITEAKGNVLHGKLKMKGIEKEISFPVKIAAKDGELKLISDTFTIDRTLWGITKSSGKFFDPVKLGDRLIKDDVEISIDVTTKAAK